MKLTELYEKRNALLADVDKLAEKKDLGADELKRSNELMDQIEQIDAQVKMRERRGLLGVSEDEDEEQESRLQVPDKRSAADLEGYAERCETMGRMVRAQRYGNAKEMRDLQMQVDKDGGFLVPKMFKEQILELPGPTPIVRSRALVIPADGVHPDQEVEIPVLKQGASGVLSGVVVQWIGEGAAKPKTQPEFGSFTVKPKEVAAHTVVTDKMLRNSPFVGAMTTRLLRGGLIHAEDKAFIAGSGLGDPLGVLSAPCKIAVSRTTAGTIVYDDVLNMLVAMLPDGADPIWVAHVTTRPKLAKLKDEAGNSIFMSSAVPGFPNTLLGIPIIFTGKTKKVGTEGDLILVDFSNYVIKDGYGPWIGSSPHPEFINNKTIIKAFTNVDGAMWVEEPLLLDDEETEVSPMVTLAA